MPMLFFSLSAAFSSLSQASESDVAWLSICDQESLPDTFLKKKNYFSPDGTTFSLLLTEKKIEKCDSFPDPLNIGNISWMEIINNDLAKRIGNRLILQGVKKQDEYRISEIIPEQEVTETELFSPLLIDADLLPEFRFRAFGRDNRVNVSQKNNEVTVSCKKGSQVAGVLFSKRNTRLPLVSNLVVSMQYQTDGVFLLGVADQRRFEKGAPINLGEINSGAGNARFNLPREKLNHKTATHWSILCPREKAVLKIKSFGLKSESIIKPHAKKSMWFWKPQDWQQSSEKTFSILRKYEANDVFISVTLDEDKQRIMQENLLADFIEAADSHDIHVWVVEGDPHVVLPDGRKRFTKRARIFSNYNQKHSPTQRLAGIQYDIEPYLVSGYSLSPQQWEMAYIEAIRELKKASGMRLEVVIPFWWQGRDVDGQSMLDRLAPYIDSLNVMNYRTTKGLINRFAQPVLDWGMRSQKPVNIALEAGPIADETQWRFKLSGADSDAGELWQLRIKRHEVLILHKIKSGSSIEKNSRVKSYQYQFERVVPGGMVTFERNKQDLLDMLPELDKQWS
ncbi:MAG: hypothetical protein OEX07_15990, partial [Gammaproteobacteria bacterium]|nr:hypothetical protein [Gammaproteobacteria bacterium]